MFPQSNFFIGQVESREDPTFRGRLRVRIMGIHTDIAEINRETGVGIPTEDLPLAMSLVPVSYSGTNSATAPVPACTIGSWVIGITLDGDKYNDLLILGVIPVVDIRSLTNSTNSLTGGNKIPEQYGKVLDEAVPSISDNNAKVAIETFKKISSSHNINVIPENMIIGLNDSLQDKQFAEQFKKQIGLEFEDTEQFIYNLQNDETLNKAAAESIFESFNDHYQSDLLAACAYNYGIEETDGFIQEYGYPGKDISEEEFITKLQSNTYIESSFIVEYYNNRNT